MTPEQPSEEHASNSSSRPRGGGCGAPPPASFVVTCALLLLLGALIIAANVNVVVLVCRRPRLQSLVNWCLASLAVSDLSAGVFALPLIVACSVVCRLPELCLAMDLCQRFLAMSTILHLLVITSARYVLIVYPMAFPRLVTRPRVLGVLLSTWLASFALSFVQLSWLSASPSSHSRAQRQKLILVYDYVCFSVFVLLPLAFIIYAHVHVLLVARRHVKVIRRRSRHQSPRARRRKGTLVYLAMIGVFVVGWFPYFLLAIEHDSEHVDLALPPWAFTVLLFMKASTALLNPLLYTYFNKDFRREAKAQLCGQRRRRREPCALVTSSTNDATRADVTRRRYPAWADIVFESSV